LLVGLRKDQIDFVKASDLANVICIRRQPYHKIPLYLGASDVLLLPLPDTLFDRARWPLRLGDYLAAGRPIVATSLPEIEKIVSECGLLAKIGDPEDFADKILSIISDPDLREEMGKRARGLAETRYSWKRIAKQLERAYRHYL
jgi:glycosyltransferase involved in cell wall biosynthesis